MTKKKVTCELYSYGIYSKWDKTSKLLPKLFDITTHIKIKPEIEFGYLLKIKGGKGKTIEFTMEHPPMLDEQGNILPAFNGSCFIDSNDYQFFLGDTTWEPFAQMHGVWRLTSRIDNKVVADKKFFLEL